MFSSSYLLSEITSQVFIEVSHEVASLTHKCVMMNALDRWESPKHGVIHDGNPMYRNNVIDKGAGRQVMRIESIACDAISFCIDVMRNIS